VRTAHLSSHHGRGIGPPKNEKKETVAELLNTFFGSVFTREDTKNIPTAADMEAGIMANVNITLNKVKKTIRNLKTASAAGPDGIGPRLLQKLKNELAPVLVIIFWRSLRVWRAVPLQINK
jgi:hypothetical protein